MTQPPEDLDHLLEVVEAATPGEWFWAGDDFQPTSLISRGKGEYVVCPQADVGDYGLSITPWNDVSVADATYIATFSPSRMKQLLGELKTLRGAFNDLVTYGPDPVWLEDLASKVRMIAKNARGTTSLGGELRSFETILNIAANQLERLDIPAAVVGCAAKSDSDGGAG